MKRSHWLIGLALVVIVVASAAAQPPSQPGMGGPPQGTPGSLGGGMCQMTGGGMCPMCSMMGSGMQGGMMGGMMPMMGMMGAQADSARMVQMRGEMLKAMGDIMMKYGKMMEGSGR